MIRLRCRWPYDPWTCSSCGARVTDRAPSSVLSGLLCDACLDRGVRGGEPYIPLTVRMVQGRALEDPRPILAVSMAEERCALECGDVFDLPELVDRIRERRSGEPGGVRYGLSDQLPPAIVVTDSSLDLLGYLDQSPAARSPFWQWQVSVRSFTAWRPEATARVRREVLLARPVRFGYASRHGKRRRKHGQARWYLLLDPGQFTERDAPPVDLRELLRFAIELRAWSGRERLPIAQTVSAYGSRLLRDARFGGGWRRKIPAATNRRLRSRLPGNHYQLLGVPQRAYPTVHKWDQQSAHHSAAVRSRFPHPDQLDVTGWFRRPPPRVGERVIDRGAIPAGTDCWRELIARAGMFTIMVRAPELVTIDALTIPPLRYPGLTWQTLTSVEVDHARRIGAHLGDIWCAWTSPDDDDRLREYALWSGAQLAQASPSERAWLKPLLLASYGMLAARPSRFRSGWRWCRNAAGAIGWQTRHGQLIGFERRGDRDREPQTANVLWRAIIESRVRLESLTFAQRLRAAGLRPIAIYADAVFATGNPIPLVATTASGYPPPWHYEGAVHDLTFDSPGRYRSREETRLPGTPRHRDKLVPALPILDANERR